MLKLPRSDTKTLLAVHGWSGILLGGAASLWFACARRTLRATRIVHREHLKQDESLAQDPQAT